MCACHNSAFLLPSTIPLHVHGVFPVSCRPVRRYLLPRMRLSPSRVLAGVSYIAYLPYILYLSPAASSDTGIALREALTLSLNFGFVTPILFPHLTPALHPCFEGLFNIVIAWALLFAGFAAEDVPKGRQRVPYIYIATAIAFLTNIVFLPYIALRNDDRKKVSKPVSERDVFLQIAESRILPFAMIAVVIAGVLWAAGGRTEFGDIATRFTSFGNVLRTDALAHSLVVDAGVFALFQSVMVDDDVQRREWTGNNKDVAVRAARFLPFFGLAFYLWQRARYAPLVTISEVKKQDD